MKKWLVVCVVVLAVANCTRWYELDEYTFEDYVHEFGKKYVGDEYESRKLIFESRLTDIRAHNADPSKTWKKGVNHLSDKTQSEFEKLLGYKKGLAYVKKANKLKTPVTEEIDIRSLPSSVDWRGKGVLTAVKDQGDCGSCWTFATAESVESYWALSTGQLQDLSEQQILDCTPNPDDCGGTGGCSGGTTELAYQQIASMGGLSSEWTYPYLSYAGQNFKCHFNASTTRPAAKIQDYVDLPSNHYAPVLYSLANIGPLAVSVDASAWSTYESGVFDGCNQTNPDLDHAVQLVGYGTDPQLGDYWIIRNSWSPKWGEQGFIRIKREQTPTCGVDLSPQDGDGCTNGPATVVVCGTCGVLYDTNYPIIISN